jgi:hypothetical protein
VSGAAYVERVVRVFVGHYNTQVAPLDDQEPVEALAADGANEGARQSRSHSALALVS